MLTWINDQIQSSIQRKTAGRGATNINSAIPACEARQLLQRGPIAMALTAGQVPVLATFARV